MIINLKTPKPQKLLFSANDEVGKYSRVSLLNLHHVLLNAWKCIEFWGLLTLNKMATKYFRVQNSKSHVAYFIWWTEINRTPLHISFPENPRGLQGIDSIFLDPKWLLNCNSSTPQTSIPRELKFSIPRSTHVKTEYHKRRQKNICKIFRNYFISSTPYYLLLCGAWDHQRILKK